MNNLVFSIDCCHRALTIAPDLPTFYPLRSQDKGVLVFSSATSSTLISGEATLMDDGLIIFPLPSVIASLVDAGGGGVNAEAPWGSGEGDQDGGAGWGAASRSSVTVEGTFVWMGGAISGNARVRALRNKRLHHLDDINFPRAVGSPFGKRTFLLDCCTCF